MPHSVHSEPHSEPLPEPLLELRPESPFECTFSCWDMIKYVFRPTADIIAYLVAGLFIFGVAMGAYVGLVLGATNKALHLAMAYARAQVELFAMRATWTCQVFSVLAAVEMAVLAVMTRMQLETVTLASLLLVAALKRSVGATLQALVWAEKQLTSLSVLESAAREDDNDDTKYCYRPDMIDYSRLVPMPTPRPQPLSSPSSLSPLFPLSPPSLLSPLPSSSSSPSPPSSSQEKGTQSETLTTTEGGGGGGGEGEEGRCQNDGGRDEIKTDKQEARPGKTPNHNTWKIPARILFPHEQVKELMRIPVKESGLGKPARKPEPPPRRSTSVSSRGLSLVLSSRASLSQSSGTGTGTGTGTLSLSCSPPLGQLIAEARLNRLTTTAADFLVQEKEELEEKQKKEEEEEEKKKEKLLAEEGIKHHQWNGDKEDRDSDIYEDEDEDEDRDINRNEDEDVDTEVEEDGMVEEGMEVDKRNGKTKTGHEDKANGRRGSYSVQSPNVFGIDGYGDSPLVLGRPSEGWTDMISPRRKRSPSFPCRWTVQ